MRVAGANGGLTRSLLVAAPLTVLLFVTGCSDGERVVVPPPAASAAFTPEQFPDIPLPRGYVFSPEQDQLAVSLAGGTVRRFEVALEQRENAEPQSADNLLRDMQRDLTALGWSVHPERSDLLEWWKGQERLVLETGRTGGRTTIRLRLRPAPLAGP